MSPAAPEPARALATVFGGSGFIGRYVVGALARRGWRVRVAVRRPHLANHLQPLGIVGQIVPVQANVRNVESVQRAMRGASAVINLVGIGYERGKQQFRTIHAIGATSFTSIRSAAGRTGSPPSSPRWRP